VGTLTVLTVAFVVMGEGILVNRKRVYGHLHRSTVYQFAPGHIRTTKRNPSMTNPNPGREGGAGGPPGVGKTWKRGSKVERGSPVERNSKEEESRFHITIR